ncbi:ABC transporter ATP-binding protein/permease [Gilvimarinus sp. SDUM040013]|uniref:ABC transporter ATP-binding protein/permease n=1 Tax=Gilvimarinus gilvus TaxID=3058038 RepID=A0ABU4RXM9_9GAMM|nr:ABC transporter ATP-binding protein/permease [Gilvimarinus sp. SDUM040013]MDO3387653.1 ABC transporter ATP-binding protein/permease [Gilvimarinus sp. SDUM040013]MDX6848906.1 ABC transporter ATP-binding protein/permease [Gilvimarinus sp. SDUM040013]
MRGSAGKYPPPKRDETIPPLSLREVFSYLWPHLLEFKGRALLAIAALLAAKGATLLMPWALKHIVDGLDKSLQTVLVLPVVLLIFYGVLRFGGTFFGELRDAIFSRITERAMRRIGLRVFKHLHKLELEFHLNRQTGGISRDIERGTSAISFLMRFLMFNILPTLFEILFVAAIFSLAFSPLYALITLGAVIVYVAFTVIVTSWRTRFVREANQADSVSNTRAIDSLINYETVKYFNNDEFEASDYDQHLAHWEGAKLKNRLTLLALNSGQALIIAAAMTAMMFLAADGVVNGELTLGDLTMVNAYMIQLFMPLNFLGFVYREIRRALTDLESMLALLKRTPKVVNLTGAPDLKLDKGQIEFRNVTFGYQPQRHILRGLNLTVPSGQKLAVVGASGAGKSTLARLLYRFYDVDNGGIFIDGQNIAEVTQESVRQQVAIVPQDTVLFNTSIRDNIAYGRPGACDKDIEQAIDLAHLRGFIDSLPEGDKTIVGERGLKVSGGEKQRIAIARVILKRSPILVFDEATSALDSGAEAAIVNALAEVARGHTTVVIAHRLSTVVDADRIVVLADGAVVERGTHTELLSQAGHYANLWAMQQANADHT